MLHNLLTTDEKKAVRNEYYARLGVVGVLLVTGAVWVGALALFPTYITLSGELSVITATPPETSTSTTSAEISTMRTTLVELERVGKTTKATDLFDRVFAVRPDSITISGLVYDHERLVVSIEGVAETRDALVTYARTLEELPEFAEVPLSISDLAKNTRIRFRLNATIAPAAPSV
jgi:hypothetical protein